MTSLKDRLAGLAACLTLMLLVLGTPAALITIGALPHWGDFTWSRLSRPDDGTLALAVIGVVAWLAWLVFTTSVAVELVALIGGIRAPRLPGLRVPQVSASRLVAIASLLFVAVPPVSQTLAPPHGVAAAGPVAQTVTPTSSLTTTPPSTPPAASSVSRARGAVEETVPYTVRRGDSLWKIAEQQLGDGRQFHEIVALNESVLHGRPDFITPGTVLRIPAVAADPEGETYVVRPGDTLSGIAQARLGDATAFPRIIQASRHIAQPDGARLTDPDVIRPGWRLMMPTGTEQPPNPADRAPADPPPRPPTDAPPDPPADHPADPPWTAPVAPIPPDSAAGNDTRTERSSNATEGDTVVPGWVLPGLMGAGALLAGSLLLVLRRQRHTQRRYRRPGRTIVPPPPELRAVEKSAHLSGSITAPRIEVLHQALLHLAATCAEPPRIESIELATDRIRLHLAAPADLGAPWRGDARTWSAYLDDDFASDSGDSAPYPMLVSLGPGENGALTLVNLEELGSLALTGDVEVAMALGRHIAAELSLNPWSVLVEIDLLGLGAELATMDPLRLHHHGDTATGFLEGIARDIEEQVATTEPDRFRALVATTDSDPHTLERIAKIVTTCVGRPGVAVVTIGAHPAEDTVEARLSQQGRLRIDALNLHLTAAGLTPQEAAACAAIVDLTREATDEPVPVATSDTDPEEALVDQAGALRPEVTTVRPDGPAGPSSLLPLETRVYEATAATTADDIDRTAPLVSDPARKALDADPGLDDDLRLWRAPSSPVPRLTLLGPVSARTNGEATAVTRRKPFYVEMLSYLVLHPTGVTTAEVCDAFGLRPDRARTDLGVVRRWLGTDPRTGEAHLPSARSRNSDQGRGTSLYRVQGVLSDLDLFRRLRTRGQSRGEEGVADLVQALTLVTGEPFIGLRPAGWHWLLDGDRLDHIMSCAIVDVAHIVTTRALTTEDFELARVAAETAFRAAPDDETARLDMVAVAVATGHADLAAQHLIEGIFERSDDHLGPIDLPERTVRIVRQRGWDRTPPDPHR